jgi:hypothetical protein
MGTRGDFNGPKIIACHAWIPGHLALRLMAGIRSERQDTLSHYPEQPRMTVWGGAPAVVGSGRRNKVKRRM